MSISMSIAPIGFVIVDVPEYRVACAIVRHDHDSAQTVLKSDRNSRSTIACGQISPWRLAISTGMGGIMRGQCRQLELVVGSYECRRSV